MVGIPLNKPSVSPQEIITELSKAIGALYLEITALRIENEKLKKIVGTQTQEQVS